MTAYGILQIGLFLVVLILLVKPLGWYMARVYEGKPCGLDRAIGWLERLLYRLCRIDPTEEMAWTTYAKAMLVFAIIAVFVAGLMVGRTPEYLGKKIEAFEMKMAALVILIPPLVVLVGAAVAVATPWGKAGISNPGPHGFSQILYAFSSAGNNNGSALAGLNANTPFYNVALALAMLVARYWLAIPTLAIAGSLARKKATPVSAGTLPTHTPLFVLLLVGVVVLVGALTFLPALALGPIVEHLMMVAG
jgi:K+-transporting ATPase ATPase A chain